jgi:hypothetical protein
MGSMIISLVHCPLLRFISLIPQSWIHYCPLDQLSMQRHYLPSVIQHELMMQDWINCKSKWKFANGDLTLNFKLTRSYQKGSKVPYTANIKKLGGIGPFHGGTQAKAEGLGWLTPEAEQWATLRCKYPICRGRKCKKVTAQRQALKA